MEKFGTKGRTLNHVAAVYDLLSPVMTFWQEDRFASKVLPILNDGKKNKKVLDIGCGTGTLTLDIAKKMCKDDLVIIGLDAAPKMIEIAKAKAKKRGQPNATFDVGIAEKLPYQDNYFDYVVSTFFFHHINFELKKAALNEIYRVLKPGGKLIIVDVDIPTNLFGKICAYSGYFLFNQAEIKENIDGKLQEALRLSAFGTFDIIVRYQGYISNFVAKKQEEGVK